MSTSKKGLPVLSLSLKARSNFEDYGAEGYSLISKFQIGILDKDTIVYKFAMINSKYKNIPYCSFVTIKLLIKAGTIVHFTSDKCRAKQATVINIKQYGKKEELSEAFSWHSRGFKYHPGETYIIDQFSMKLERCGSGIHFFRTLKEVKNFLKTEF